MERRKKMLSRKKVLQCVQSVTKTLNQIKPFIITKGLSIVVECLIAIIVQNSLQERIVWLLI